MPPSTEDTAELLGRDARCSRSSAPRTSGRVAAGRGPAPLRRGRESSSARATTRDTCYIVRSGHARAIREHSDGRTITLAHVRPRRHLRRAGDVRRRAPLGDGRGDRRRSRSLAILGADMRRLMREHPRDRGQARDRARAGGCARPTSGSPPVLPDRAEPRRRRARPARRAGARRGRGRARRARSPPPRPTSRSSPAPRASRPAASSPCSSAPGVIRQGRGRLTVHDPAALRGYVY